MSDSETIVVCAIVFVILFIIKGIAGSIFLPDLSGRFFIAGVIFAVFGTGAGSLIFKFVFNR